MATFGATLGAMSTDGEIETRELRLLAQAVAERPWLSLRYLRRLVYEGRIRHYKVGGKVLVDLADIDALAESGRREPLRAS